MKERPSNYAQHLLEIARLAAGSRSGFALSEMMTITMAQQSQLEERLQNILSKNFKCRVLSRFGSVITVALISTLLFSLALVRRGPPGGRAAAADRRAFHFFPGQ